MKTDNELIAHFIGLVPCNSQHCIDTNNLCWSMDGHTFFNNKNLKYDTSWDWLMPVVQRIGKYWEFMHPHEDEILAVITMPLDSDIQEVYKEVVKFIKWHNNDRAISR